MSKFALDRCRSLTIRQGDNGMTTLEVYDPARKDGTPAAVYVTRTHHDAERLRISLIRKYRIPKEKVTDLRVTSEPQA